MSEMILNKTTCFTALPREWEDRDLLTAIQTRISRKRSKIVILDDDPTGTQTIHDLPVLTSWDVDSLKHEFEASGAAFFILTNSRAMTQKQACKMAREIGTNLKQASAETKISFTFISRSDSTLRGHFPHEVDAMAEATGLSSLPYLICPFFLEGGRYTVNDIHYVAEKDLLVPASRTAYAKDTGFGFTHSHLGEWVEEKTGGRIPYHQVVSIGLDDIRQGGPEKVGNILMTVPEKGACIVNAVAYKDIEVVVAALLTAEENKKHFLFRTAASFVRVRTGCVPHKDYLSGLDLQSKNPSTPDLSLDDLSGGGLFIVGSYVPKTTAQVTALVEQTHIVPIEINVENVLDTRTRNHEIQRAVKTMNAALANNDDAVLYTSRKLVTGHDPETSLAMGQTVSDSLIAVIQGLECRPRYMVAKGGITSSDVAIKALNVKRALVLGQVLPGVPVWRLGRESLRPGLPYIIFPGNVGNDNDLVVIHDKLKQG